MAWETTPSILFSSLFGPGKTNSDRQGPRDSYSLPTTTTCASTDVMWVRPAADQPEIRRCYLTGMDRMCMCHHDRGHQPARGIFVVGFGPRRMVSKPHAPSQGCTIGAWQGPKDREPSRDLAKHKGIRLHRRRAFKECTTASSRRQVWCKQHGLHNQTHLFTRIFFLLLLLRSCLRRGHRCGR